MKKASLFIVVFHCYVLADTIVDISITPATGTWTKAKSPYTVNGGPYISSGTIRNLEIQAGVIVNWQVRSVQLIKGYLRINGTENDSVTMTAPNASLSTRIFVYRPEQAADTEIIQAKYARFSNICFDGVNRDAVNCTIEHCYFTGNSSIHGNINITKLYKTTFENTSCLAIDMLGEKEYTISCCVFNNFYGLSLVGAGQILIDSCFLNKADQQGIKFGNNNRIIAKNNIITNGASTQGAGLSLEYGNRYALIVDNVITNNAGGGISAFNTNDTAIFIGNLVANNTAAGSRGGAILHAKKMILLNNTLVNNSDGLFLQYNPLLAINNIIFHNGTSSDSIQVRFGDSISTASDFYNCFIEFGVDKFKLKKYFNTVTHDSMESFFHGIAKEITSTSPGLISGTLQNPFGYTMALMVFPTCSSNTNNRGLFNPYLSTLSKADIIGTSWTKDDSVDIGAIQYINNIVASNKIHTTRYAVKNTNYQKCDLLGRSFDKEVFNKIIIRDNSAKIILK